MGRHEAEFELRLSRGGDDLRAAQRLRYEVFVAEMGATGPGVDHAARRETDRFDPESEHLMLWDRRRPDMPVGVYRLMDQTAAARAGGFYSAAEYDLAPLLETGRPLLELGRSCLHRDYRGGMAMHHLWQGLARIVEARGIAILFGVASFPGTDTAAIAAPLSLLHHGHLAPPALRVRARDGCRMDLLPADAIDRRAAVLAMPALIKAYLRLGGVVGEGAHVDRAFNTTDVCLILDVAAMPPAARSRFGRA